jgi:branched-chain amino acid transport system permease protein
MSKKALRSARNSANASKNFLKWLPRAIKHFFKEVPPSTRRFKPWASSFKGALTLLCLTLLFVFPLFQSNLYILGLFVYANMLVIFAASWDLLAGFAGQSSFGQAAFLGLAAYITADLVKNFAQPWWVSMFLGAMVAVLLGLVIGIPFLRLRGPYFALGTLAFTLMLSAIFSSVFFSPWLGGSGGIYGVSKISADPVTEYLVVLVLTIASVLVMVAVTNSRVGTVFKAIRDDETSAEALGINTTKYKLVAFMISAFFAGIAGSIYALHLTAVSPPAYSILYSFYAIVIATLGGIATIYGSIGGAYFFVFMSEFLGGYGNYTYLAFAFILLVVLRFASNGTVRPLIERLKEFWDTLRGK